MKIQGLGEIAVAGQVLGIPAEDAVGEGGEIVEIGVGLVAEGGAGRTADEGAEGLLELDATLGTKPTRFEP